MPARIYALAKELKIDSKELVDLVKKVGITGKGSALASLTDEEAQKVRDHLAGSDKPAPAPAPTQSAPTAVRDAVPKERKQVSIKGSGRSGRSTVKEPAPKPEPDAEIVAPEPTPVPPAPPQDPEPAPAPVAEASEAEASEAPSAAPPKKGLASRIANRMAARKPAGAGNSNDPVAPVRRERPSGLGGKMRSLDRPTGGAEKEKKPSDGPKPKRREPRINVKMASLPEVAEQQKPKSNSGEPKAQKPDVKLSKDVIAGHRQGMRAPLEELAKEDEKRRSGGGTGAKQRGGGLSGFTGEKGKKEEEEEKPRRNKLAGMASPRAERTRGKTRGRAALNQDRGAFGRDSRQMRSAHKKRKGVNTAAPRKDAVVLELPCTIRSFSEAAGIPAGRVLMTLMGMGMQGPPPNINSEIDFETAEVIAAEMDLSIELKESETLEETVITELEQQEDDTDSLQPRAPIVTFLGHVDHGKTSLLDYLIGIDVVSGEAGGITQHIRAYEVEKNDGRSVTFVDTPGHEAFTEMRARGANVTDIAVLVIAADDGVMPQTEEAISHAKAAEVPIVVAMNKIDLEGADPNRVMTQMTEYQLTPSEWGGDVEVVQTSATKGTGMDELLETLLTIAELNEYKANPDRTAMGICLESEQQGDRGVVAKLVVQNGTLKVGDVVVCGTSHGRVRAMSDTLKGQSIEEAGPSTPINVMGFDQPPGAGERFYVLDDISKAREIAEDRAHASSQENLSGVTTKVSFDKFQMLLEEGRLGQSEEKVQLNLIVRADVKGSLEAIDKELSKFDHPEVEIRVLQRSVGGVTLADATLASASDAVIVAFNVIPDEQARSLADEAEANVASASVTPPTLR
ncbi:MAG: translation initiation factor IF-2 [Planctomycetota bacterium]